MTPDFVRLPPLLLNEGQPSFARLGTLVASTVWVLYDLNVYGESMPRIPVKDNSRVALRIRAADKAKILRAVALERTDLTDLILENTLRAADSVIERAERLILSERDSMRVLDLLENLPAPNDRLLRAAKSLPQAE